MFFLHGHLESIYILANGVHVFLFVYYFTSPARDYFAQNGDVFISGKGLQNLFLCPERSSFCGILMG